MTEGDSKPQIVSERMASNGALGRRQACPPFNTLVAQQNTSLTALHCRFGLLL